MLSAPVYDAITDLAICSDVFDYATTVIIVTQGPKTAAGTGQTPSAGITTFHSDDYTLAERINTTNGRVRVKVRHLCSRAERPLLILSL